MIARYFAIYSFPDIDFSLMLLSAILQHEKTVFSILMTFIPNTCPAHQNYPVAVKISILRILQHSKMLLLQVIPCCIIHRTACFLNTAKSHICPSTAKARLASKQRTHVQAKLNPDFAWPLTKESSVLDLSMPYIRRYHWIRCWHAPLTLCAPAIIIDLYTTGFTKASV